MARYKRLETLTLMKEIGVIPVFYNPDFEVAKGVITACAKGGARVVELVNRGDRAFELFSRLEEYFAANQPEVILGVGSVGDAATAALFISAGANFVVGPVLNEDMIKMCNMRKIPCCPGCGSASEIHKAHSLGVEICKVFPGGAVGGPTFAKSVKAPMPWTDLMPTGGVSPTEDSLREWFDAGVACVGIGSKLVTKELVAAKDYDGITKKVKDTIELIKKIRSGK